MEVHTIRKNASMSAFTELQKLIKSHGVHRRIDTRLANKEIMVNYGHMVLSELHIKLNVRGTQVGGRNEGLDSVLTQLKRLPTRHILTQTTVSNHHCRAH